MAAQQATERQARSVPLAMRVGLSVGEVAFEEGDVFGTPVVEAARLVAVAGPGRILATTVVRVIAGSRAGVAMRARNRLSGHGNGRPIHTNPYLYGGLRPGSGCAEACCHRAHASDGGEREGGNE